MKTLYYNGTFYSMENEHESFSSLVTENGMIIATNDTSIKVDRKIDCLGGTVFPGFVDAHLHIAGLGQTLTLLNLNKIEDKSKSLTTIASRFNHQLLYVQGYLEHGITKDDLDRISTEFPIIIRHADYHSATVNSKVLEILALDSQDGILKEIDAQKAVQLVPPYTLEQLTSNITTAIQHLYQYGVTGGHSDDMYYFNGYKGTLDAFKSALKKTPFRTHLLMHHEVIQSYLDSNDPWLDQNNFLQLGAVKIFYDGTISSQTALMSLSYSNQQQGQRLFSTDDFKTLITFLRKHRLPIAVHTIGDLALDELTDWLMQYPPVEGLHDRIIHASFAKKSTLEKLKKLPVILDIQPQFVSSDLPTAYQWIHPETELIYPWKSYADQGITLCGGSDAPVEIPSPLLGIQAAFFRRSSLDGKTYQPEEKLSLFEAIKLYTTYSQIPTYHISTRGYIKKGYIADFTVVSDDMMKNQTLLEKTKVIMTIIDDQIVYNSKNI
jgi:predicted amidohydrolase YtcJ